jgi:hypothetical protein
MSKLHRLLTLTERVLLHLENQIPPEAEVTREMRALLNEIKNEGQNTAACKAALGDEKAGDEKVPKSS